MRLIRVKQPCNKCRMFYLLPFHTHRIEYICLSIFYSFDFIEFNT